MLGERGRETFATVPESLRTPEMQILYAADRDIVKKTILGVEYGSGRSGQLAVGTATVTFDPKTSWDELVKLSTEEHRDHDITMKLTSASEFGRLAIPLENMEVRDGRYVLPESAAAQIDAGRRKFHEMLAQRLAQTPTKDVYIFVHGFNNTFEDAIFRLAMIWHMAGRPGVPIVYTWPAGYGGLKGYAYDRESGEFTVFHLKLFLEAVASCPQVERIHLIAHSRGTDVLVTALRELNIETRAKNLRTKEQFKLDDLVLAAPDMDDDVFEQRFAIEDLHLAANRTTIYLSQTDIALAFSRWLFGGGARLGNLTPKKLTPDAKAKLSHLKSFYLINCAVSGFSTSHDYAFAHPAVVSDLILLLRDNKPPGAEHGRPLKTEGQGVWEITNDYLREPAAHQR
jgi:esterase/lipase superfamily enzyme